MSIKITLSLLFAFCFIAGLQGAAPQKASYLNLPSDMFGELVKRLVETGSFEAAAHSIENLAQANQPFSTFLLQNKDYIIKMLLHRWGITTPHDAQEKLDQLAESGPASGLAISALVQAGADINKSLVHHSPLSAASSAGNKEMVLLLINNGANVNQENSQTGRTPLHWAAVRGYTNIVDLLLNASADQNPQDISKITPLMKAAEFGHLDTVKRLLDANTYLNLQDEGGRTALIVATIEGHKAIVNRLLEAGADPTIKDNYGRTARDYKLNPVKVGRAGAASFYPIFTTHRVASR